MKRLLLVLVVAAGAVAAVVAPRPPEPPEPLAGLTVVRPGISSPANASIWYCPWAQANASRDSFLAVAAVDPVSAAFTLPVAIPGEEADRAALDVVGPGASGIDLSSVARRGDSPFFVEFDDGPAAVSVTVAGEGVLAADACVASGPDAWHFAGGATVAGDALRLRVFNPFPETAKVTITAVSEIGVEALADLRSISIGPRTWRDFDFESLLRQRQNLVVSVSADEGLVVPAMSYTSGGDSDWWPGAGLSARWDIPVVSDDGLDGELVVFNPGLGAVEASVVLFTAGGEVIDAGSLEIEPSAPARITLPAGIGPAAATISATGPVSVGVVARGDAGTAVMPGVPERRQEWLLPGLRSQGLQEGSLWILNSGEETVSVSVTALTGGDLVAEKVLVDGASLLRVPVSGADTSGYLVESSDPISVAWSLRGPTGTAFASASPVADG